MGKQWKDESDEVKAYWKAEADAIKEQHAKDNPDYQYAPRKPSEKKRRMTSRKLAKLTAVASEDASPVNSPEMFDVPKTVATDFFGVSPDFNLIYGKGNVQVTLPVNDEAAFTNYLDIHNSTIANYNVQSFDPDVDAQVQSCSEPVDELDQVFFNSPIDWETVLKDYNEMAGEDSTFSQGLNSTLTEDLVVAMDDLPDLEPNYFRI